jgi:hypothetical protein
MYCTAYQIWAQSVAKLTQSETSDVTFPLLNACSMIKLLRYTILFMSTISRWLPKHLSIDREKLRQQLKKIEQHYIKKLLQKLGSWVFWTAGLLCKFSAGSEYIKSLLFQA